MAECEHKKLMDEFMKSRVDDEILINISAEEIRKKYPRKEAICPDCGDMIIMYWSYVHYLAGDY